MIFFVCCFGILASVSTISAQIDTLVLIRKNIPCYVLWESHPYDGPASGGAYTSLNTNTSVFTFDSVSHNGDTSFYYKRNILSKLTIVYDRSLQLLKSLTLNHSGSYLGRFGFSFRNVPAEEAQEYYVCALNGLQIDTPAYYEWSYSYSPSGHGGFSTSTSSFLPPASDSSSVSISLTKYAPLEVKRGSSSAQETHLYPNPATEKLTIEGDVNDFEIFDQMGRKHFPTVILWVATHIQLDVSRFPAGYYWLRVGKEMHKVVIY